MLSNSLAALAQDATPSPSPQAPTPEPTGLKLSIDLSTTFVSQSTGGPGTTPPEAAGFVAGTTPLEPNTPYDALSLAVQTPGNVGIAQGLLTTSYLWPNLKATAVFGAGYVDGSSTNAAYWAEPLIPPLNPHLGQQGMPYALVFPTHAGQDDTTAFRGSLLYGEVGARDQTWDVRAGWFDLAQTDRFVFAPVVISSVVPALGPTTQESLVPAYPALDSWQQASQNLPLHGVDVALKHGLATAELTDAALPAPPGIGARVTMGSFVVDHGEGTRWSAELAHVTSGGDPLSSLTLYGSNPQVVLTSQGLLPMSTLGGQRQTTAGVRGAFHVGALFDGLVEVGRSWFEADQTVTPTGGAVPGGYDHVAISRTIKRATAAVEWYRFDPYYAPFGMAYGANENFWTAAWGWPAYAFETGYQSVDNTIASNNRQGPRLRFNLDGGPLEMHLAASRFVQLVPDAPAYYRAIGFTESKFPPEDGSGTLGRHDQLAGWIAWHPGPADVILDLVYDKLYRAPSPGHPEDAFDMSVPEAVLTLAKTFNANLVATAGLARFAQLGSWATVGTNNVDFAQRTAFLGAQWRENEHFASMLTVRRTTFSGAPYYPGGPVQDYQGWMMLFEQRLHY